MKYILGVTKDVVTLNNVDMDSYKAHLQNYYEMCDELEHSLMTIKTRESLEVAREAVCVILDMYEFDYL